MAETLEKILLGDTTAEAVEKVNNAIETHTNQLSTVENAIETLEDEVANAGKVDGLLVNEVSLYPNSDKYVELNLVGSNGIEVTPIFGDELNDVRFNIDGSELKHIAEGKTTTETYADFDAMKNALLADKPIDTYYLKFKVGDNLLLEALNQPDWWVLSVNTTYVDTATGVGEETTNGYFLKYNVGYYTISQLETTKVDLSDYITTEDNLSTNEIIIGNGGKSIRNTGLYIQTEFSTFPNGVPTSSAIDTHIDERLELYTKTDDLIAYTDGLPFTAVNFTRTGDYSTGIGKYKTNYYFSNYSPIAVVDKNGKNRIAEFEKDATGYITVIISDDIYTTYLKDGGNLIMVRN